KTIPALAKTPEQNSNTYVDIELSTMTPPSLAPLQIARQPTTMKGAINNKKPEQRRGENAPNDPGAPLVQGDRDDRPATGIGGHDRRGPGRPRARRSRAGP